MFVADDIPDQIADSEQIVRFIFSPINVNLKTGKIKSNAFKSPRGVDEISVTRLDYCDEDYCKANAVAIQNPEKRRNYFGLGLLIAHQIRRAKANINASPIMHHPAYGDISVGFVQTGDEYPAEYQFIVDELASKCRLFTDPDVESDVWTGESLKSA